jgi:hypothetical protein
MKPLASLASLVTLDWLSLKGREMIGSSAPLRSADSFVTRVTRCGRNRDPEPRTAPRHLTLLKRKYLKQAAETGETM